MGMDNAWNAPGWGFILGSQDPTINKRAAEKSLVVTIFQTHHRLPVKIRPRTWVSKQHWNYHQI